MSKTFLAIDINTSAVRFVRMQGDFVVEEKSYTFTDKKDYRYKQQLEDFWSDTNWKEVDFSEISLSWSDKHSTLVPVNVFNESSKENIFQFSFGKQIESSEIDYNRLPLQGIVNVFNIPLWVKSFFVVRFPRIILQHEGTYLIRGIFNEPCFKLKAKLILHDTHFIIIVVKENTIKFYSSFEYSSMEDIVYYYSFAMQQLNFANETNDLVISSGSGSTIDSEALKNVLSKIHGERINISTQQYLIEKYQLQCV